jgi:hypothetical protein
MAPGPRSKRLNPDQIAWLKGLRKKYRSTPQMNQVLASPFKWRTLQRAIDGNAISEASHAYIVQWLQRYATPFADPQISGKDRASGERDDENEEAAPADGTIRGSR